MSTQNGIAARLVVVWWLIVCYPVLWAIGRLLARFIDGRGVPSTISIGGVMSDVARPPASNTGVEFLAFRLDWLSFTVWADPGEVATFALGLLGIEGDLGQFEKLNHGSQGFQSLYLHSSGMRLSADPAGGAGGYCAVAMSGEVASCCSQARLIKGFRGLGRLGVRYNITRLDLAFDTDVFKPIDVYDAVLADDLRSLAKRQSLKRIHSPLAEEPSDTVYLGSRTSERFLRVYLGHGMTRVELECKGARALAVFRDLLALPGEAWAARAMAHLRDFVDFGFAAWSVFTAGADRAHMIISHLSSSIEKVRGWLWTSVAASFALIAEVDGAEALDALVLYGFSRFSTKQLALLAGREFNRAVGLGAV